MYNRSEMHSDEFKARLESKRRKMFWIVCLTRLFCCPCIALWNITKI